METDRFRRPLPARALRVALRALGGLLALVLVLAALSQTAILPAPFRAARPVLSRPAERDARWAQDVRYLAAQLPRLHANAFFQVSEPEWRAEAARLEARIPALSDDEIKVEIARLVALLGDGHSRVHLHGSEGFQTIPLGLRWFTDGLYVLAAAPEYRPAIGARVVQIGGLDAQAAYEAVVPLIAHDNQAALLAESPVWLTTPEALAALGIVEDAGRVTYLLEGGDGARFALEAAPTDPAAGPPTTLTVADVDPASGSLPLYLRDRDSNYWFEYLPESRTIFFQYNRCAEMESLPFAEFAEALFAVVDEQNVQRIVVDLRANGGGNSGIIRPFLAGLEERPALSEEGRLFAIIGRGTFSSGMWNALDIQERGGTLVGEPTGGRPNAYGEVRRFRLPNSGLAVQYSTRYWQRLPGSDPPSVMPDLPVEPSMADYLAGRDVALEAILGSMP